MEFIRDRTEINFPNYTMDTKILTIDFYPTIIMVLASRPYPARAGLVNACEKFTKKSHRVYYTRWDSARQVLPDDFVFFARDSQGTNTLESYMPKLRAHVAISHEPAPLSPRGIGNGNKFVDGEKGMICGIEGLSFPTYTLTDTRTADHATDYPGLGTLFEHDRE